MNTTTTALPAPAVAPDAAGSLVAEGQPKVWENLSFLDYRKLGGLNASVGVKGLESMLELQYGLTNPELLEDTKIRIGTALHSLAEFGSVEAFLQQYTIMPDFHLDPDNKKGDGSRSYSKSTTWYQDEVRKFTGEHGGNVISQADYDKVRGMLEALLSKKSIKTLMDGSHREVSIQAFMREVLCKSRLDGIKEVAGRFDYWDIKSTTGSIERKSFGRIIANQEYIWKLAWYWAIASLAGIHFRNVYLLVVSQKPPHDCARVPIPASLITDEVNSVAGILDRYRELQHVSGRWPGVDDSADDYEIEIPNWHMQDRHFETPQLEY